VDNDYNRVFETLVEDNTDLIGMIAYARYKATKQSWLRRRKAVLESEAPEIRGAALTNHTLEQANATLTSVTRQNVWWRQLIVAALGAFAYSVLLAAIVVVLRLVGVDVLTVLANATT
jgi:hypothetical protein